MYKVEWLIKVMYLHYVFIYHKYYVELEKMDSYIYISKKKCPFVTLDERS